MTHTSQTNYAVAPGEYVQEWMENTGADYETVLLTMGCSPVAFEEILSGKTPISVPIAEGLERLTGTSVRSWLSLETQFSADCWRLGIDRSAQRDVPKQEPAKEPIVLQLSPLDVACPQCGAKVGHRCSSITVGSAAHRRRTIAAGQTAERVVRILRKLVDQN